MSTTTTAAPTEALKRAREVTEALNEHQEAIRRLHVERLDLLLTLAEQGKGVNAIARDLGLDKSTISPLLAQARARKAAQTTV